jgi:hypothetical protein
MSVQRFIVVVPVLAGLVVTGSAVARMMPAQSVRDSVYPVCAHNGVHFNKQGHANCGLHKGWTQAGATAGADQRGAHAAGIETTTTRVKHGKPAHPSHPVIHNHGSNGHGAKAHGPASHAGKAHGGGAHGHANHGHGNHGG